MWKAAFKNFEVIWSAFANFAWSILEYIGPIVKRFYQWSCCAYVHALWNMHYSNLLIQVFRIKTPFVKFSSLCQFGVASNPIDRNTFDICFLVHSSVWWKYVLPFRSVNKFDGIFQGTQQIFVKTVLIGLASSELPLLSVNIYS